MFSLHQVILAVVALTSLTSAAPAAISCPYDECTCTVENIDCTNKGLTSLPALKAGDFTQLELDISGNQITAIGDGQLPKGLHDIYSKGNPIQTISDHAFIDSANTLINLVLDNGKFTDLPKALEDLDSLSYLEIAHSELKNIVATKEILPNLYFLNLVANKITDLSGIEIFKHSIVSRLDLHNNQITDMSPLSGMDTIKTLNLLNNQICDHTHISAALAPHLASLDILNLKGNCLKKIPDFSGMAQLTRLLLSNNAIDDCTSGNLPDTAFVQLSGNQLTCIPDSIKGFKNVNSLLLSRNNITSAAVNGFTFPSSIHYLDLSSNKVDSVTNIKFDNDVAGVLDLYLNNNPLTTIADGAFAGLNNLTKLELSHTNLQSVPIALKDLPSLKVLKIQTNTECDCTLGQLGSWYKQVAAGLTIGNSGKCGSQFVSTYLADLDNTCNNVVG